MSRVFVSGASGCVGRALSEYLTGRGHDVRRGFRAVPRDADNGVHFDLDDDSTLAPALKGCVAAVYLVHGLTRGDGYEGWEAAAASAFARAAVAAGVKRLVYLGGVVPSSSSSSLPSLPSSSSPVAAAVVSTHLRSRARTGEILRAETEGIDVVELRAGMIIAAGSVSFTLARDVAARLPFVLRPPWLRSRQQPVALTDVVAAIDFALQPTTPAGVYACPGPETLAGDEVLVRLGQMLGHRPRVVDVPGLTHAAAARALAMFTRAPRDVVVELVFGMTGDLCSEDPDIFDAMVGHTRQPFALSASRALRDEDRAVGSVAWLAERAVQRTIGRRA